MSLIIYAVGDIMLGEQPLCNNLGVKNIIEKNGADFLFNEVSPLFREGDIVFGNLECSINGALSKSGQNIYFFSAVPEVVNGLKNAHFNVLSVANNHIMENGRETFIHTIRTLIDNGITPIGIKNKIEILNIKGYKIAFLGYSFMEDDISNVCYNKVGSSDAIIKDIQKVKSVSNLIIVSLHWGFEYIPLPSPDQIQIGRDLVDAGADIILGGHSHITQSYEIYKNRPIFFSLGNFIFDHTFIPTTREAFIAEITVSDSPDSFSVRIIPFIINESDYHPQIESTLQSDTFLKNVETIRNAIENRSLADYRNSIGDYNLLYNKYKKPAKWKMKVQFAKNFYHFSVPTIVYIIKNYFENRLGRKQRQDKI